MRLGLPISLLLHALILAWGLIAMKSTRDFKKIEPVSIALEIISEGELAQMRKGDEKSKEKEVEAAKDSQSQAQKETPKPKPVAAQPPPPPPKPPEPVKEESKPEDVLKEMAKTEPKPPEPKPPEVKPEAPKPPEPKPEADDALAAMKDNQPKPPPVPPPKPPEVKPDPPKAVEKKPVPPKPKPAPPQPKVAEHKPAPVPGKKPSTFDAQQIAALIDKSPNAAPAPASTASPAPTQKASRTAAGTRDGTGPKLSMNEQQALAGRLVGQIKRCWRTPTGIPDAQHAIPVVSFKLARDGTVSGTPQVMNRQGSTSFQLAAEAATRAVMQCQPYDMPADKYEGGWSEVELEFDPSSMFGG